MAPKDWDSVSYSSLSVFTDAEHIQCIWKRTDASTKWLVSLTKCTHSMSLSEFYIHSKMYNF